MHNNNKWEEIIMRKFVILSALIGCICITSAEYAEAESLSQLKPENSALCIANGHDALNCAVYCTAVFAIWNICF